MRKLMTSALIAATAMVATAPAAAQSYREVQRSRQEVREEQRELRQAYRRGDRGDVRDARGDLRDARQDLREDLRDRNRVYGRNDWYAYRNQNRALYARGNWNAPFRYQAFRPGYRIQPAYFGPRYVINDPWRYRLPPARPNARWVRHYNDVLLVDYRRNVILDVLRNFYF